MSKFSAVAALLLASLILVACTTGRTIDQQRENAKGAQEEMSTDTHK